MVSLFSEDTASDFGDIFQMDDPRESCIIETFWTEFSDVFERQNPTKIEISLEIVGRNVKYPLYIPQIVLQSEAASEGYELVS